MSPAKTTVQSRLDRALDLAAKGFYVFPMAGKGSPLIRDWPSLATTDAAQLHEWWRRWPDASPGVVPDRSGLAVIDIDQREGEPDGFQEADAAGAPVMADVQSPSASGRGVHLWFRGRNRTTTAINGIKSVDSRGAGGLIFIHDNYATLPPAIEIVESIPVIYRAEPRVEVSGVGTNTTVSEWTTALDAGDASEAVEVAAATVVKSGMSHQDLLDAVDELVRHTKTTGDLEVIEQAKARYALGYEPRYVNAWDKALEGSIRFYGLPNTANAARLAYGLAPSIEPTAEAVSETAPASGRATRGSWSDVPFDEVLEQIAAGSLSLPTPTVGLISGTDQGLFYLGRVNGVAGESGSGKGWIAFRTAAEQMKLGRDCYYLDFEDSTELALLRLTTGLGVDPLLLRERFHYIHPQQHGLDEIAAFVNRVRSTPDALVILDSTGESIGQSGRAQNADEEVAAWFQELPHPLSAAGATVLLIDHLVKSPEGGLWPSGSQRKRAAITGTQLIVEVVEAPAKDADGLVILKVAKDRHGARSAGSAASLVRFTHQPFTGQLVVTFDPGKTAEQMKADKLAKVAAQLDADVFELQRLAPPPTSVRDVKDRSGWGTARASEALREFRSRGL